MVSENSMSFSSVLDLFENKKSDTVNLLNKLKKNFYKELDQILKKMMKIKLKKYQLFGR